MKRFIYLLALLVPSLVLGDGIMVYMTEGDYLILPHTVTIVDVNIEEQVATTEIKQVFINSEDKTIDAIYFMPLPVEASVVNFSVFKNGRWHRYSLKEKPGQGQIDTSGVAEKIPGLDDYLGENRFVMPIESIKGGDVDTVKLTYTEFLPYDEGWITYLYPLYSAQFLKDPLTFFSVTMTLNSKREILDIVSDNYDINISTSNLANIVTYSEENFLPEHDFDVRYRLRQDSIGLYLYTYKERDKDGYYLLIIEPSQILDTSKVLPKNFVFVFDRSGSMDGIKIEQTKQAAEYCIANLLSKDYFNVIRYNSSIQLCFDEEVRATDENKQEAINWIESTGAIGMTNINDALITALHQWGEEGVENEIIFLTDGLPTSGVKDPDKIIENVKRSNTHNFRIFSFGFGADVDSSFLRTLAIENGGEAVFVAPNERAVEAIKDLYDRIAYPFFSYPVVDYGVIETYDYYPPEVPSIYHGSQVLIFGRYKGSGTSTIKVTGKVRGEEKTISILGVFPVFTLHYDFLPRSWAKSKIDYWLKWMEAYGEVDSIIDMIVELSLEYGILTPYTGYEEDEEDEEEGVASIISSFTAKFKNNRIELSWNLRETSKDIDIVLERKDSKYGDFRVISHLPYYARRYVDEDVMYGVRYTYRLTVMKNGDPVGSMEIEVEAGETENLVDVTYRDGILLVDLANLSVHGAEVSLFDVTGKKVKEFVYTEPIKNVKVHVGSLASGIYFVRVRLEDGEVYRKIYVLR